MLAQSHACHFCFQRVGGLSLHHDNSTSSQPKITAVQGAQVPLLKPGMLYPWPKLEQFRLSYYMRSIYLLHHYRPFHRPLARSRQFRMTKILHWSRIRASQVGPSRRQEIECSSQPTARSQPPPILAPSRQRLFPAHECTLSGPLPKNCQSPRCGKRQNQHKTKRK
jgi:hypothetical protein